VEDEGFAGGQRQDDRVVVFADEAFDGRLAAGRGVDGAGGDVSGRYGGFLGVKQGKTHGEEQSCRGSVACVHCDLL